MKRKEFSVKGILLVFIAAILCLGVGLVLLGGQDIDRKTAFAQITRDIEATPTADDLYMYTLDDGAEVPYTAETWVSKQVFVVPADADAGIYDIRLQYLTDVLDGDEWTEGWRDFTDLTFDTTGVHSITLRYATDNPLATTSVSESSEPIYVYIDMEVNDFEVLTEVPAFSREIRVFAVNTAIPVTYEYAYVTGGTVGQYQDVPASMVINAGWDSEISVRITKLSGISKTARVSTGAEPTRIEDSTVRVTNTTYTEAPLSTGWTRGNISYTLGLSGPASMYAGVGTYQYSRNGGTWTGIIGNIFTVTSTSPYGTGSGDEYRFRFTGGGYTTAASTQYNARIDKHGTTFTPQITVNESDVQAGISIAAFILKVTVTNMPVCGIQYLRITNSGNALTLNAQADGRVDVTNPSVSNHIAILTPQNQGNRDAIYDIQAIDNMGRASNTRRITLTPPQNSSGNPLTVTGNPTTWARSGTLTFTSQSLVPSSIMFSKDGSAWASLGLTAASGNGVATIGGVTDRINTNGTYYFYSVRGNGAPSFAGPIVINRLDTTTPTLDVDYVNGTWVRSGHEIRLLRSAPGPSGIARVEVQRASNPATNVYDPFFAVTESGSYTFRLFNGAGTVSNTVTRTNILVDKTQNLTLQVDPSEVLTGTPLANGWLNGYMKFELNAVSDYDSAVPITYWYQVGGTDADKWLPVDDGDGAANQLFVRGNINADYYFMARTAGGVEKISAHYPVKIDDSATVIDVNVRPIWYAPESAPSTTNVKFEIYSNIGIPYTVSFLTSTNDGQTWSSPMPVTPAPAEGDIYWYHNVEAGDIHYSYKFIITTDSGRIAESEELVVHNDTSVPTPTVGDIKTQDVNVSGWARRVEIPVLVADKGPSGVVYQYRLYNTELGTWGQWLTFAGDIKDTEGNVVFVMGEGGVVSYHEGAVEFRTRRGFPDSSSWSANIASATVKVDGLARADFNINPSIGGWTREISWRITPSEGGSGLSLFRLFRDGGLHTNFIASPYPYVDVVLTENGVYTLEIQNNTGVFNVYTFEVWRIDNVNPHFSVSVIGVTGNTQQPDDVTFLVTPRAGYIPYSHTGFDKPEAPEAENTVYQYQYRTYNPATESWGSWGVWTDINADDYDAGLGAYRLPVNVNCYREYRFQSISATGMLGEEFPNRNATYIVHINKVQSIALAVGGDWDGDWTPAGPVLITLTVEGLPEGINMNDVRLYRVGDPNPLTSYTYAAPTNGDYIFYAEYADATSPRFTARIRNIDDTEPRFNVNSMQNISPGTTWDGRWNSTDVVFNFIPLVSAPSGVKYYFGNFIGGEWVKGEEITGIPSYRATESGTYRFYSETNAKKGYWSEVYVIKIDREKPTLTIDDITTTYTTSGYAQEITLDITATVGVSEGEFAVYVNGRRAADPADGEWNAGKTIYTATYKITANARYEFRITNGAGATHFAFDPLNPETDPGLWEITKIDNIAPVFTVTYAGGMLGSWIASQLTFTIVPEDEQVATPPPSGVTYYYTTRDGSIPWQQWTPITNLKLAAAAGDNTYRFMARTGTGTITELTATRYRVMYDSTPLSLTVQDLNPTGAYASYVDLDISASWGLSAGTFSVIWPNGDIDYISDINIKTYRVNVGGTYVFRLVSGAFADDAYAMEERTVTVSRIEDASTTRPSFTVTSTNTGTPAQPNWVNGNVTFEFSFVTASATSGLQKYQYQRSSNGVFTDEMSWLEMTGEMALVNNVLTLSNSSFNDFYRFRAVSNAGNPGLPSSIYRVNIDKSTPNITIENSGALTGYRTTGYELLVKVTYGGSNVIFTAPAGMLYELDNNLSVAGSYYIYRIYIPVNGTYTLRAVAGNSEIFTLDQTIGNIESTPPTFNVSAPGTGSKLVHVWVTDSVTFTFTDFDALSGLLQYEYQIYDELEEEWDEDVWYTVPLVGSEWVLTDALANGLYRFRAISKAHGVSVPSAEFRVNFDPAEPAMIIMNENVITDFTKDPITLYVKVVYGVSGGDLAVTGPEVSVYPDSITEGQIIYRVTIYVYGDYTFVATGMNNKATEPKVIEFRNIEATVPEFHLSAPKAGTSTTENWVTDDVTFTFADWAALSGLGKYEYRTRTSDLQPWSAWETVPLDGNKWAMDDASYNGLYQFRAISTVGNRHESSTVYRVSIDAGAPDIEIYDAAELGVPTNKDFITLFVKVTYSLSGGKLAVSGGAILEESAASIYKVIIRENGDYVLTATGGNNMFGSLEITVSNIIRTLPTVLGGTEGSMHRQLAGRTFTKNVEVSIADYDSIIANGGTVTITNSKGKVIKPKFVNGTMLFDTNGSYTVTVRDAAGNETVEVFFIDKPNYVLIGGLSAVGLALLVVIIGLSFMMIRKSNALKRLIANTSNSADDSSKFVMYKKA